MRRNLYVPVGVPVGYRKDGRPIFPIRGAEDPPATLEDALRRLDSVRSDLVRERDRRQSAETREQEARQQLDARTGERDTLQQQINAGAGDVERRISEARTQGEQAGRDAERADWQPRLAKQTAELIGARARQVAIDAGVKPEQAPPENGPDRVGRFLALVDLSGLTGDDGTVNADELSTRVRTTATANPEFLAVGAAMGGGNTGQGAGGGGAADVQLRAQVDQNVNDMFRTLRRPLPAAPQGQQAAGAAT